ncbi:NAD(P)/FAD-dependent oxidoreductase [Desulforegula conservatrix]|uniref:NAD(P)/FAD-dependent oxidoreductase n=1 Tax=Desulforegula conservatrix TaxID=153026 RepID=UPI0003FCEC5C|nr:FAD-dependent oxidoreductase [Desulforegula conservatrix]
MQKKSVFIIGGGVVGLSIGCEIQRISGFKVFIIEKNSRIKADNQSSRNSGVIHAGIYYPKSKCPIKAGLCVEGNPLLYEFCVNHNVPHKNTGKLVVATSHMEIEYLEETYRIAEENGVPGMSWVEGQDIGSHEPNVKGVKALLVPTSGIVDAMALVSRLHAVFKSLGGEIIIGAELVSVSANGSIFSLDLDFGKNKEAVEADYVINAAGLYSDEVARMIDPESPYEVEGVRGEAAKFYADNRPGLLMSGMNVYPAPYGYCNTTGEKAEVSLVEFHRLLSEGKITKTVGVHLTPAFDYIAGEVTIGKTITIGPAKTVGRGKDDYGSGLRPVSDYLKAVKRFFPDLTEADIELHQAGIMAVPKNHSDYIIKQDRNHGRFINLIGIDSPGLTSCLALGRYVKAMLMDSL